jgi:hypothetical protein
MSTRPDFVLDFAEDAITLQDAAAYQRVVQQAVDVHMDRERIRHGLWKQYSAMDQIRQAKIKVERVFQALEYAEREGADPPAIDILEEIPDIINYSIFAARILKGEV